MAYKTFKQLRRTTAIFLPPVLAASLCIVRDDHDQAYDQPHDHHENAPVQGSTLSVLSVSGTNTASIFGDDSWSPFLNSPVVIVKDRPNFRIKINSDDESL
jgi:hypothetical protein